MAGIDKTYTSSYQEYRGFKDWADTQVITFFDGHRVCVVDYVYDIEEIYFNGREIPIMNTPTWLDTYLIQNCPFGFVQARMEIVYNTHYEELKSKPFPSRPVGKQNRKIKVARNNRTRFPIHNKAYGIWWLQCNGNLWFNDETGTWADPECYPTYRNSAHFKTVKAVVRHLREQYLPDGITFTLHGRYVGEEYLITVN